MDLEALKQFLSGNKDSDDLKNVLTEHGFQPKTDLKFDDSLKSFIESDEEAKKYLSSTKDKFFTSSLESWKSNNLENLINEEIKKRFPEKSPEQVKLAELEFKIQESERKAMMAELRAKARDLAKEKNLPFEFIDRFIGENEEATVQSINDFEKIWTTTIAKEVEKRMAGNHRDPNQDKSGGGNGQTFTTDEILKMDSETLRKNWATIQKMKKK
jgi:hypothetical protein